MRRCMVLIEGLPRAPPSTGAPGPLAWSDETMAALSAGHSVVAALVALLGDDKAKPPPPPEPPPVGWRKTQEDNTAWEAERLRRFKARQQKTA